MAIIGAGGNRRKQGTRDPGGSPNNGGEFTVRGIPLRGKNRMGIQHMTDGVRSEKGYRIGTPKNVSVT